MPDYMVHTVSPEKKEKKIAKKIFILSVVVYHCRRHVSFCLCCVQISFPCTLLSWCILSSQNENFKVFYVFVWLFVLECLYLQSLL